MKKIFFVLMIFLSLSNCGFNPIYSSDNMGVSINKIEKENTVTNNYISDAIRNIFAKSISSNKIDLSLKSKKEVIVKSKDKKGDPLIFQLNITVDVTVSKKDDMFTKVFSEKINFKNNDDKFKMTQYQTELEKILLNKILENIVSYLSDSNDT